MTADYKTIDWTINRTSAEWKALAEEMRNTARGNRTDADESFDRCDTDGALSQWASGCIAEAYELAAAIAEDGGRINRRALFTLDGQFVTADLRHNTYGMYWHLPRDLVEKLGLDKPFVNYSMAGSPVRRARFYASKGFAVGEIRIAPYVTLAGGNYNVRAVAEPNRDALRNGDFEVLTVRHGDTLDTTADDSENWRHWTAEELAAALDN